MAIEVEAPDGTIVEFPDDTDGETINRVMRKQFGGPTAPPKAAAAAPAPAEGFNWSKVPYLLRPSQMTGTTAGDFFGGHLEDAARSGRSMLRGVGGVLDLVGEPIAQAIDYASQRPKNVSDLVAGRSALPRQYRFRELADMASDAASLPRPQTAQQRVVDDVGQALSGTALTMGVGAGLGGGKDIAARAVPTIRQQLSNVLTSQPGLQAASAATGGAASGITREAGGGTGAQVTAAILGGLTPAGITAGAPATIRGVMRGSSGQRTLDNIAAFEAAGTSPTVGQASEMPWVRGMESILSKTPGSAGYLARTGARQGDEIGEGVEGIAATLVPKSSAEDAGRAITRGIRGPGGFVDRTKAISDSLYAELDAAIPADARVDVGATRRALAEINAPIPGAPATSKQFQNARIGGIRDGLESDLKANGTAARPEVAKALQLSRQRLVEDAAAAAMRNTQRQQLGLSNLEKVPTAAEIDAQVAGDLQGLADGRLPYEALRRLRSVVGRELEDSGLMSDVPRSKWKQLYGALSQDLEAAAASSPAAQRAWGRANMYYRSRMARLDAIDHVIDKNGGPEAVFNAALSGTRDGATTLRAVLKSLPKEGQRELTAAFVRRLGKATNSAQNDAGDAFSTQTFLTNWNRVSPEARAALFDRHGMQFSRDMDKIARVASNLRDGSEIYKNPAGTTASMQQASALTAFVVSFLTGNVGLAGGIASAALGANVVARALASPKFVRWLAQSTEKPVGAIPAQLQALRAIAKEEDMPELQQIADSAEQLQE